MGGIYAAGLFLVIGTLLALRRVIQGRRSGLGKRGTRQIEVLDRVGLGHRQGIALVRIRERVLAVGYGEGAPRMIAEVDAEEAPEPEEPRPEVLSLARRVRQAAGTLGAGLAFLLLLPEVGWAQEALQALDAIGPDTLPAQFELLLQSGGEGIRVEGAVGMILVMGILSLLPGLVLMMTSFTRFIIVFHMLRQALGTQTAPPGMLLGAMALILTGFVMWPTVEAANEAALSPYLAGEISQGEMIEAGLVPFRDFMGRNTRAEDMAMVLELADRPEPASLDEVATIHLMTAFTLSELRTAFYIALLIFLPFVVIDIIVGGILISLGVFMLPPALVSLPIKLLVFVVADGWNLLVWNLVEGYS